MTEAIEEFQQLDKKINPIEKLACLQDVTVLITKMVSQMSSAQGKRKRKKNRPIPLRNLIWSSIFNSQFAIRNLNLRFLGNLE